VLRGAAGAGAGFAVRLGARLLLLALAGRLYGAALFGAFGIAVSTVEVLVALAGLSTKRTLFVALDEAEEGARPPAHAALDAVLLVGGTGLLLGALTALGAALFTPTGSDVGLALLLLAPMVAGQALLDVIFAATRWAHVVRHEVIGRSLVEPYAAALGALGAFLLGFRSGGLAIGYGLGTLAALAYGAWALKRTLGRIDLGHYRPDPRTLRGLLVSAQANTGVEFLKALYGRLDIYLVGLFLGTTAAGVYNAARQFRTPIRQLRTSFDSMLTPITATTLRQKGPKAAGEALISAARLLLLLQIPVLLALAALGGPVLGLFGPGLEAGAAALVILAAAEVLNGALGVSDLLFVYCRPRLGLLVTAVGMAVGGLLGLVLIPALGLAGAAGAVLGGYGVHTLLRMLVLRRSLGAPAADASLAVVLGAGCAGLAAVLAVQAVTAGLAWDAAAMGAGLVVFAGLVGAWAAATGAKLGLAGFIARSRAQADGA
jgi:O-antigen/teichoic acid export membrane protein